MKAFCITCGVFASIQELEGVAELYGVSDGYLSDYMKKRITRLFIGYRRQYLMD